LKLPDLEIRIGDSVTAELLDWIDVVRMVMNQGKYSLNIESSVPISTGNDGDHLIYTDGAATRRLYTYFDSAWRYISFDG